MTAEAYPRGPDKPYAWKLEEPTVERTIGEEVPECEEDHTDMSDVNQTELPQGLGWDRARAVTPPGERVPHPNELARRAIAVAREQTHVYPGSVAAMKSGVAYTLPDVVAVYKARSKAAQRHRR